MIPHIPYLKDKGLTKYIQNMVELHMTPHMLLKESKKITSYCRLFDKSCAPRDLICLAECDKMGRAIPNKSYEESRARLLHYLALYEERMRKPSVMGRDLIEHGYKPGVLFKEALDMAHNFQVCGTPKDQALNQVLAFMAKETRRQEQGSPKQKYQELHQALEEHRER